MTIGQISIGDELLLNGLHIVVREITDAGAVCAATDRAAPKSVTIGHDLLAAMGAQYLYNGVLNAPKNEGEKH